MTKDKDFPLLHVYPHPRRNPHDDVVIISSRSGLLRLKEAIDNALENEEGDCVVATSDLESFEIKVILNEENWRTEFWQRLQLPFNEDDLHDKDTLSVDDILSYDIRNSIDVKDVEEAIKADRRYSQEITDKLKRMVERNSRDNPQRIFMRILDSNDLLQLDEYVNNYGVNHEINGTRLLYWAAYANKLSFVSKLLELGADPNLKDSNGRGPLEIAAYYGFYDVCKTLLQNGARISKEVWNRAIEGWGGNVQQEIIELLQEWQDR